MPTDASANVNSSNTEHRGFCGEKGLEGRTNSLGKRLPSHDMESLNSNIPSCDRNKKSNMDIKLSSTMENYLEAIYELSNDGAGVRVSDIAERLGVTKASTNSAMATLAAKGLVINKKYKEIFLTPEGRKMAEKTSQKHHIIQRFFTEVLDIEASIADEDACAIEHVISNESVLAMKNFLQKRK